ncbi:MAG: bifunctional UDP-N-acetylglucosamine diphosphorylase/glucosamine-1-phosphate N-acetyltransferase GlmU [Nitrospirota bacterium]
MNIEVVVLSAGLGTRMRSSLPKVLHRICGVPMLQHVLNALYRLGPRKIVIVVGEHIQEIKDCLVLSDSVVFAYQEKARGTADALRKALPLLSEFNETILVINGDAPLITAETLRKFLSLHKRENNSLSVLSFESEKPGTYGRIVRDYDGRLISIKENRDVTAMERSIREVNSGIYAFERDAAKLLGRVQLNKSKGEYYLTDVVRITVKEGVKTAAFCIGSEDEFMGINTQEELERARQFMRHKIIRGHMARGVNFVDGNSAFIDMDIEIGSDTVIYPNVYLEGNTRIGKGCILYPNVRIFDSVVEHGAVIKDSTLIENAVVKRRATIGPFAHLRPGTEIGKDAKIGNFVEVKKSVVGPRTKALHLTYLGDSMIGANVNVGAGTITCNYDGYQKNTTTIEDNVFVGSDSQLIAPVRIGKGAYVGAGATITKDVPDNALALSRVPQKNIEGWVLKRKLKVKSEKLNVKKKKKT